MQTGWNRRCRRRIIGTRVWHRYRDASDIYPPTILCHYLLKDSIYLFGDGKRIIIIKKNKQRQSTAWLKKKNVVLPLLRWETWDELNIVSGDPEPSVREHFTELIAGSCWLGLCAWVQPWYFTNGGWSLESWLQEVNHTCTDMPSPKEGRLGWPSATPTSYLFWTSWGR